MALFSNHLRRKRKAVLPEPVVSILLFIAIYLLNIRAADTINVGETWQTVLNNNPGETVFVVESGTHTGQQVTVRDNVQLIGDDNDSAKMQGNNSLAYAIYGAGVSNVTIRNLEITGYDPDEQYATIKTANALNSNYADGWLVENCEIHHNDGAALRVANSFSVRNNYIHHQEQIGLTGGGDGSLVEGNEIAYCNWEDTYTGGGIEEEGGTKFANSTNLTVRGNYSHHNHGPGFWTDIDNIGTLYEHNRVDSNTVFGIFHEISDSAIICCNVLRHNGTSPGDWGWGANIMITNSKKVDVYGNIVEIGADSGDGIIILEQSRGSYHADSNSIHHNDILFNANRGICGLYADDSQTAGSNNSFDYNRYRPTDISGYRWYWEHTDDITYHLDWAGFLSYGQETHGWADTVRSSAPDTFATCSESCTFPTISSDPVNQSVLSGEAATFSLGASGASGYQWKRKSKGAGSWTDVGTSINSYGLTAAAGDDSALFRCEAASSCGPSAYSTLCTLFVCVAASISFPPSHDTVENGNSAYFDIDATGSHLSYQWQRNSGGGWGNAGGATDSTYTFSAGLSDDGLLVRCIAAAQCGGAADTSDSAWLVVTDNAPSNLSYSQNPATYYVDQAITPDTPTVTGTVDSYSVSPALPAGLTLDTITGVISGTPTTERSMAVYTVTATNTGGSTAANVTITVTVAAPSNLSYSTNPAVYIIGFPIAANTPTVTGTVASYTLDKALPAGLSLNGASGIITGTPTVIASQAVYTVIAANGTGATTAGLTITVNPDIPANLAYAVNPAVYRVDSAIAPNTATVDGTVDSFTVSPALPAGLSLDKSSGTVSGTPQSETAIAQYTVIAHNASGTDTAYLDITILPGPDTTAASNDIMLTATGLGPSSMEVQWTTPESQSNDADSVHIYCMPGGYPEPQSWPMITVACDTVSAGFGSRTVVVDSLMPYTLYFLSAWVSDTAGNISSRVHDFDTTLVLPDTMNPVVIAGTALDASRINLTLSGYSNLPSTPHAYAAYVDSILIWYDSAGYPAASDLSNQNIFRYSLVDLKNSGSSYTNTVSVPPPVSGSDSTYFFIGAPVWHFGKVDSIPQFVSGNGDSIPMTGTASAGIDSAKNLLIIDSLIYDSSTSSISVSFRYDTASAPWESLLQAGIDYGFATYPTVDSNLQVVALTGVDTTVVLKLRESFLYDTIYYVALFFRDSSSGWLAPIAQSRDTIRTPRAPEVAWEYATFAGADTQITAFDSSVVLTKNSQFSGEFKDTLHPYSIPDSIRGDMPAVGDGFSFANGVDSSVSSIGMKIGTLPAGVSENDVRIYRVDSTGVLTVEHDSYIKDGTVWLSPGNLAGSFILLADTTGPAQSASVVSDTSNTVAAVAGQPISDTITISERIANLKWRFLVAQNGAGDSLAAYSAGMLSASEQTVITSIPASAVDAAHGVYALLVLNDGVNSDTINLSWQVARVSSDPVVIEKKVRWYPLYATAELNSRQPCAVLRAYTGAVCASGWYSKKDFRLLRWFSKGWHEYETQYEQQFSFVPGRIIWICLADTAGLNLGNGRTVSMKSPVSMTVPGGDWLDFGLPYKFSVRLSDILATSGSSSDTLRWYRWNDDSTVYTADAVHLPGTPGVQNRNAIFTCDTLGGYAVYNSSSSPVTIRIPPVSTSMAPLSRKSRQIEPRGWGIKIVARRNGRERLNTVICGYEPGMGGRRYYPAPPGFSDVYLRVYDEVTNTFHGYATEESADFGGTDFKILFDNSRSDKKSEISWQLQPSRALPDAAEARMIDPNRAAWEQGLHEGHVVLAPGACEYRFLVAGTQAYLDNYSTHMRTTSAQLIGVTPNPFSNRLLIRYQIPYCDVRRCEFSVCDLKGRRVWQHSLRHFTPGPGAIAWRVRDNTHTGISGGVYLLRMELVYGPSVSIEETVFRKRIFYIP